MRPAMLTAVASTCLIAGACQSTPSGTATGDEGQSEGEGPNECEVDEDCAPDEVCVQDYGKTCESSCDAREPDLELCGCAEGQYCEPGDSCPAIGCSGGQLCTSGECHDVGLAAECAEPTGWSLNTTVVEAGSGVVAIRLAQLTLDAIPELVMLRPGSVELRGGSVWSLPETEGATMIRAANVAGQTSTLLIASADAAWLYASVFENDPLPILEQRESFSLSDLVDAQLGDFGGGPELDVWLQGEHESALYLGDAGSGFAEPLSFAQWTGVASTMGDLDLDGRDDISTGAHVWLGGAGPFWATPSLTVDEPAWLGSAVALPLAIPEGLVIAWTAGLTAGEPHEGYTAIASYLALDSRVETASADAVLFPGRPDLLIGAAGPSDDGWLAIEDDELVVYRELADGHCRAVTLGTGVYVDGQLDASTDELLLLTADGAVEQWLRL